MKYVVNTIKLVVLTSLFATVFGQLIGYINSRGRKLFSGNWWSSLYLYLT